MLSVLLSAPWTWAGGCPLLRSCSRMRVSNDLNFLALSAWQAWMILGHPRQLDGFSAGVYNLPLYLFWDLECPCLKLFHIADTLDGSWGVLEGSQKSVFRGRAVCYGCANKSADPRNHSRGSTTRAPKDHMNSHKHKDPTKQDFGGIPVVLGLGTRM